MSELPLSRKLLFGGAAALGLAAGAAGVAVAQSSDDPPAAETEDGNRDPSYISSITAPEGPDGQSEADETAALASLATVTEAQARDIALGAVPGEVSEIELENENGSVVWSVDVTAANGSAQEVVVDAGNGEILAQEAYDEDSEGEDEGSERDGADDEGGERGDD